MKKRSPSPSLPAAPQSAGEQQSIPIKGGTISDDERSSLPKDEEIASRAHQIWENQGRPEGRADEHWFQALCELCSDEPIK